MFTHQYVLLVGMAAIVYKTVDQNASLAVTGLMEGVFLAVNQDGKDLIVICVMTLIIFY